MTKLTLVTDKLTNEQRNIVTGQVLLARIIKCLNATKLIDDSNKLEIIMNFESLCKISINKDHNDFCIVMWEQLELLKSVQDNEIAELSDFRTELNEMSYTMKTFTKGNLNESTNH